MGNYKGLHSAIFFGVYVVAPALFFIWWLSKKPRGFPPGPTRWPIIGNLINLKLLGGLPHEAIQKLAEPYGEVMGFYFGPHPIVVISGKEAIREALLRQNLDGRPEVTEFQKRLTEDFVSVIFNTEGPYWQEQRLVTMGILKHLGFGTIKMEPIVQEEIQLVFEELLQIAGPTWGKPIYAQEVLGVAGVNVMWRMLAGERFDRADVKINHLLEQTRIYEGLVDASGGVVSNFPLLLHACPWFTVLPKARRVHRELYGVVVAAVKRHLASSRSTVPDNFIDCYLAERGKHTNDLYNTYTSHQLASLCMDLFVGGASTFYNLFSFALLYLVLYPKVQERIHEELDSFVGRRRLPSYRDGSNLLYTAATIQEVLRISCVIPMGVAHASVHSTVDVDFRNYTIPKNSRVLVNLGGLHMDKEIWGDPGNFRPERFIDFRNRTIINHDALLPFGMGKRACIGEDLVQIEIFLFLTALLQNFRFTIPHWEPRPSTKPRGGLTLSPEPFKILVEIRT